MDELRQLERLEIATILVIDDDEIVAKSVELSLLRGGFRVSVTHSGAEGLRKARRRLPDLIILDILMPGMDGYAVCRELRADPLLGSVPVLFLTAKSKDEDKIEGFRVGADDYLTKPFNIDELVLRVKAILRRNQSMSQPRSARMRVLQVGDLLLDCYTFLAITPSKQVLLTPIQFDLLYYLMSHAGQVFSAERLLREVWGYPFDSGSPDLVRVHVRNIRERIEPDPARPTYLRTVKGHGYTILAEFKRSRVE
jgi:two-component system response regulator RpaA